ncbi:hypothetical protein BH11CYA1_BH11CYA1_11680 [soil metagenome]
MDKVPSRQPVESTNIFDGQRSGETNAPDNLSDARMAPPERQQRSGHQTYRLEGGGTIEINDSNVTINNYYSRDDNGGRQQLRVGRGQGSMCPEYNDYASSRQAYQEEAYLNRGDSYDQRYDQRPIPQCRHRQNAGYEDRDPRRYGDVQSVSAGQYDYDDRRSNRRHNNPIDGFFNAIGSIARGIGDVAYEARPILNTWAQIEMIKHGGAGGHYYGSYADNSYYNPRPYNPWNSRQNRDLISYNNNSGYYDNSRYNDRYYEPSWMNG